MKALATILGVAVAGLSACGAGVADLAASDQGLLVSAAEDRGTVSSDLSAAVTAGSTLQTTTALNLRTGPGTNNAIRLVMPAGAKVVAVDGQPSGAWYQVKYNGTAGWAHGGYLVFVSGPAASTPPATPTTPASSGSRDQAIVRAQSGVGFSYWWGHGRWAPGGVSTASAGSCTGSCPSCSHSGGNGADCSGYVGKIWQVPSSNVDTTLDSHPYSTANFVQPNAQWATVSRAALSTADALVYNQNGAGHIFLYESGDGWGSMWAYEAKGCSYGIVHDLRTASSAYQAIRRAGY